MAHLPRTIGNGVELIPVQPSVSAPHSLLPAAIGESSLASHEERLHGFADDNADPDSAPEHQQVKAPVVFRVAGDDEFLRWDLMIVFPSRGTIAGIRRSESAAQQDALRNTKREEVLTALKGAGLLFKLFYNFGRDAICCKLSATVARLRIEAVRTGYLMQLPEENPFNGAWCEYTNDARLTELLPQRHTDPKHHRSSIFRQLDRIRLIEQIIGAKTAHGGANLDLNRLVHDRFIIAHYALHDRQKLNELQTNWASWSQVFSDPPLDTVKNYFGETIGLYFAWLHCYTQSLAPLAAMAVALYAYQEVTLDYDNIFVPIFALLTSIWASFFLRRWQRENMRLTVHWGTRDFERAEVPRPQFWGDMRLNPINGRLNVWFSPMRRALRVCFSQAVITLLLVVYFFAILYPSSMRIISFSLIPNSALISLQAVVCISLVGVMALKVSIAGTSGASIISGVVNGVIILVLNAVYKRIAMALNDFENHRTHTEYEDQLIIKTFLFQARVR
jgi:hypothetical protein